MKKTNGNQQIIWIERRKMKTLIMKDISLDKSDNCIIKSWKKGTVSKKDYFNKWVFLNKERGTISIMIIFKIKKIMFLKIFKINNLKIFKFHHLNSRIRFNLIMYIMKKIFMIFSKIGSLKHFYYKETLNKKKLKILKKH